MNALQEYLNKKLCDKLKNRLVITWYDSNKEFVEYVDALHVAEDGANKIVSVKFNDLNVRLARFNGSFFEIRNLVETLVGVETPDPLLIYLPGCRYDDKQSLLMELDLGGCHYETSLKKITRNLLRKKHTDGVIDEMLAAERLSYSDVVGLLEQEKDDAASMLKVIFSQASDWASILAVWLADDSKDTAIIKKNAASELGKLIEARLGLKVDLETDMPEIRAKTIRYVLVNEFRSDLNCDPPLSISKIATPPRKENLERIRDLALKIRKDYPDSYIRLADTVEAELDLRQAEIGAEYLGSIDTFRFEERALLTHCGELIVGKKYAEAMKIVDQRRQSFWMEQFVERQAQWEVCRVIAELGMQIQSIIPKIDSMGQDVFAWIKQYTSEEGWFVADLLHRHLETWVAKMDEEPETEQAIGFVRREYEELLKKMAVGFTKTYQQAKWIVSDVPHQTKIYQDEVESYSGRSALFLVDAFRFEMGVEFIRQMQEANDPTISPAIAALPTITPVGMGALLPGASSSFSVVEQKKAVAAKIEGTALAELQSRMKLLKAKVPDVVEMTIGTLLQKKKAKLKNDIGSTSLVVIRSQEIDRIGETGDDWQARQVMDTVIGNLSRAVRKLADAGIEHFVITADHGFQFSMRKEDDMKLENPGGDTIEIHRRCWIGRGGKTPTGALRISAAELGYDSDLEFIFPTGLGVFPTQGSLSYHHGGFSLQELIVPVITFRYPVREDKQISGILVTISKYPSELTNRTFGMDVAVAADMFEDEPRAIRIVLLSGEEQVGTAGMAMDAEYDRPTGLIRIKAGSKSSVGMRLDRDEGVKSIRIVVLDPSTDAVLTQSENIPVRLGI